MKTIKLFAIAAMICAGTSMVKAQTSKSISDTKEWQSFYVQYNPMTLGYSTNVDDCSFNGFTIGYNKAIGIVRSTPLFIEIGVAGQAAFYTNDDNNYWDFKYSLVSLKVPVSLVYKWSVSNNVAILPYAGLTAKYHVVGNLKREYTGSSQSYDEDYEKTLNLFDKKDMGDKNSTWHRFQLGYQIGVNVMFNNRWHLGLGYGKDFSDIVKKGKFSTVSITAGVDF